MTSSLTSKPYLPSIPSPSHTGSYPVAFQYLALEAAKDGVHRPRRGSITRSVRNQTIG
eukprot:gene63039-86233_t